MTTNPLEKLKILSCIDESVRRGIIDNAEKILIPAGKQIFKEHDVADNMYVIISGRVSIYITDENAQEMELGVLSSDDFFGEQGILAGGTGYRNASAKTLENTQLVVVSKLLFQTVVDKSPDIISNLRLLGQNQLRHRLLQESELFHSISLGIPIQQSLSEASFSRGDLIYQPGTEAKWFYLVLWGVAELIDIDCVTKKRIGPGEFFGETELIDKCYREQTAIAKTELLTLKIDAEKFVELFRGNPSFGRLIIRKSSNLKSRLALETV